MLADIRGALAELLGDLGSGPPIHDQLDHLPLRWRQAFEQMLDIFLVFLGGQLVINMSLDDKVPPSQLTRQALPITLTLLDEEVNRCPPHVGGRVA